MAVFFWTQCIQCNVHPVKYWTNDQDSARMTDGDENKLLHATQKYTAHCRLYQNVAHNFCSWTVSAILGYYFGCSFADMVMESMKMETCHLPNGRTLQRDGDSSEKNLHTNSLCNNQQQSRCQVSNLHNIRVLKTETVTHETTMCLPVVQTVAPTQAISATGQFYFMRQTLSPVT